MNAISANRSQFGRLRMARNGSRGTSSRGCIHSGSGLVFWVPIMAKDMPRACLQETFRPLLPLGEEWRGFFARRLLVGLALAHAPARPGEADPAVLFGQPRWACGASGPTRQGWPSSAP